MEAASYCKTTSEKVMCSTVKGSYLVVPVISHVDVPCLDPSIHEWAAKPPCSISGSLVFIFNYNNFMKRRNIPSSPPWLLSTESYYSFLKYTHVTHLSFYIEHDEKPQPKASLSSQIWSSKASPKGQNGRTLSPLSTKGSLERMRGARRPHQASFLLYRTPRTEQTCSGDGELPLCTGPPGSSSWNPTPQWLCQNCQRTLGCAPNWKQKS